MPTKANYENTKLLNQQIRVSQGLEKADLVIKKTKFLDVFSGAFITGDIAVNGKHIVGTVDPYSGKEEIDGGGLYLVPGFIDSHVHIESSLMTPQRFEQTVLPFGTTSAIWDPHEIANVKGSEGIIWAIKSTEDLTMDVFIMVPSCVPASSKSMGFETGGAEVNAEHLRPFIKHPRVLGLAEMMNFPGLLAGDPDVLEKIHDFKELKRDGHCPMLSGKALNAYGAAGISTCHESISIEEAKEKLSKGIQVLIREGSCAKNANALLPLINSYTSSVLSMCSDDRNPADISKEGHIDFIIKEGLRQGIKPESLFRVASFAPAQLYGLADRGCIAPGYLADFCLIKPIEDGNWQEGFQIVKVFKSGVHYQAAEESSPLEAESQFSGKNMNLAPVKAADFHIEGKEGSSKTVEVRVIDVQPNQIVTKHHLAHLANDQQKGLQADPEQDILKIAVLERHQNTGHKGIGFVKGFGLKQGAIATSINHDSHNVIVVGASDHAMSEAVDKLISIDGGIMVWKSSDEWESLALPIGGLMTNLHPAELANSLYKLKNLAKQLGCGLHEPFLQLSFLALPVIPSLKITDQGLVDVDANKIVPILT
ncbi:MAG: adenine deaminase [Oligoflexales bacterium]|nr:adenine deaminase [Oligoflexales bacterium]